VIREHGVEHDALDLHDLADGSGLGGQAKLLGWTVPRTLAEMLARPWRFSSP
jgi:hypothetical protein